MNGVRADHFFAEMKTRRDSQAIAELQAILSAVGPGAIWRPVLDRSGRRLADGIGDPEDGLAAEVPAGFFEGKSVIDVGCNFGAFTFMAARGGARSVLGVDVDARIIRGCLILKKMLGVTNADFLAADLTRLATDPGYDLGMMIDFIGKETITTGFLPTCLDVMEGLCRREMLFSIRPVYDIVKRLGGDGAALRAVYSAAHVRSRHFLCLDYVQNRFDRRWDMHLLSAAGRRFNDSKQTVLFVRR